MEQHDQRAQRALDVLRELGSRPAVSFFESGPARYIEETVARLGLDVRRDGYGNIIAHYRRRPEGAPYQPALALVAHMDHPGFEITEVSGQTILARPLGGVPVASMTKPTPVLVLTPDGARVPAEVVPLKRPTAEQEKGRTVAVRLLEDVRLEPPVPVVFDLPDFVLDDETIRMRALDDLAGCAAAVAVLERLAAEDAEAEVYGVFTRAEESGLLGARLTAEAGTLPRDTLVVSIESSPVIPGVAQGEGPVIRTGDRAYTFDADAEQVLGVAAESLKQRNPDFKVQRQLMSGGVCEATAFSVFGYTVTGLAFPLGNYHNATTSIPNPDGGVDAEYIRLSDFLDGIELLTEAAKCVAKRDESGVRQRVRQIPDEARRRLADTREA